MRTTALGLLGLLVAGVAPQHTAGSPCADLTGRSYGKPDGVVNVEDLLVLLTFYSSCKSPATQACKQMDIVYNQEGKHGIINIEVRSACVLLLLWALLLLLLKTLACVGYARAY